MSYTISTTVDLPYDRAVEATRAALADQGFGVLTEIDLRATLRAKLDVDVAPQIILGACRPQLAHQALGIDPSIAAVLPSSGSSSSSSRPCVLSKPAGRVSSEPASLSACPTPPTTPRASRSPTRAMAQALRRSGLLEEEGVNAETVNETGRHVLLGGGSPVGEIRAVI